MIDRCVDLVAGSDITSCITNICLPSGVVHSLSSLNGSIGTMTVFVRECLQRKQIGFYSLLATPRVNKIIELDFENLAASLGPVGVYKCMLVVPS